MRDKKVTRRTALVAGGAGVIAATAAGINLACRPSQTLSSRSSQSGSKTRVPARNPIVYGRGVYAIQDFQRPAVAEATLDNPGLAGLFVAMNWNAIESKQDVYDWSQFDDVLNIAKRAGWAVSLAPNLGGAVAPAYVLAGSTKNITLVEEGKRYTTPVYWDPFLLSRKQAFYKAMGAKYASHPLVQAVVAVCCGLQYDDWDVPHDPASIATWLAAGYTTQKLVAAAKGVIDFAAAAFPQQAIKCPVQGNDARLDADGQCDAANQVTAYGYQAHPKRFYAEYHGFDARSPLASDPAVQHPLITEYDYLYYILRTRAPQIGIQMSSSAFYGPTSGCALNRGISPCPAVPTMTAALERAASYNPTYIEIFRDDGLDRAQYSLHQKYSARLGGDMPRRASPSRD